jgi:hypothetical protein
MDGRNPHRAVRRHGRIGFTSHERELLVLIQGNSIANFRNDTGIFYEGTGTVEIKFNNIDGDPLHVHAQRAAAGKWDAGHTHYAVRNNGDTHGHVIGNSVRNCGRFAGGNAADVYEANILYCNPNATGDDADNAGIRYIADPALFGSVQIEDCDPASATCGRLLMCVCSRRQVFRQVGNMCKGTLFAEHLPDQ